MPSAWIVKTVKTKNKTKDFKIRVNTVISEMVAVVETVTFFTIIY